jgi:hypothetical protein
MYITEWNSLLKQNQYWTRTNKQSELPSRNTKCTGGLLAQEYFPARQAPSMSKSAKTQIQNTESPNNLYIRYLDDCPLTPKQTGAADFCVGQLTTTRM